MEELGRQKSQFGLIFNKSQNKFQESAKPPRLACRFQSAGQ